MATRKTARSGPALNPIKKPEAPEPPRITPRNSDGDAAIAAAAAKETPYSTLHQLANIPKPTTPLRRASSAGPPSGRSTRRTPVTRTPGAGQRGGGSARRQNAVTPHGRAAMREVEARRAGLTPGKNRRQSGIQRRETPRDDLRALSRLLAPKTKPTVPTPPVPRTATSKYGRDDFVDDDTDMRPPRLSLALDGDDEDDEDESLLLPPQSAGLEDEDITVQSMEFPRRAISEMPPGRLSRGSFGSIRLSDQFGEVDRGGVFDSSFAIGGGFNDEDILDDDNDVPRDNTATLRDINLGRGRVSLNSGRNSDIRGELPGDDTDNTFAFMIPPRDVPSPALRNDTSPAAEFSLMQYNNDSEAVEEEVIGDPLDGLDPDTELPDTQEQDDEEDAAPESDIEGNVNHEMDDDETQMDDIMQEDTILEQQLSAAARPKAGKKKKLKLSKHGIPYPSLPAGVVKKLATTYARTAGNSKAKLSKDTLDMIMQASDWFFEQVSGDLGAYAGHAGRKTVDESDMVTLMNRQRQTNATTTPFSLAQKHLPRELLQDLRMVPPSKPKKRRRLEVVEEAED